MLDGFDVCAFMVSTPEQMMTVVARCVDLGIAHGDIHDRGEFGIATDVADPDGTVLRFVAGSHTGPPGTFAGVEFGAWPPNFYDQPRLIFKPRRGLTRRTDPAARRGMPRTETIHQPERVRAPAAVRR
jgi:hypothetical protein